MKYKLIFRCCGLLKIINDCDIKFTDSNFSRPPPNLHIYEVLKGKYLRICETDEHESGEESV